VRIQRLLNAVHVEWRRRITSLSGQCHAATQPTWQATTLSSFSPFRTAVTGKHIRWGDGTSWNDVSLYKVSRTPSPQNESSQKHNVPALIHPCHYASCGMFRLINNDRDVGILQQEHCVSGTIHFRDQKIQKIRTGTHRFRTPHHPTVRTSHRMHRPPSSN